ncbi:unnamed protein product [Amoebophrya sp. A120]|nr:unnamed protein product [Amoebophrya sp. A120]|eukprot:GSA120T00002752001.1
MLNAKTQSFAMERFRISGRVAASEHRKTTRRRRKDSYSVFRANHWTALGALLVAAAFATVLQWPLCREMIASLIDFYNLEDHYYDLPLEVLHTRSFLPVVAAQQQIGTNHNYAKRLATEADTASLKKEQKLVAERRQSEDLLCFEPAAVQLQKQHEAALAYTNEFHRTYVGLRHFEVVELVSTTQASQLITAALRLFESAYMGLMQVLCPVRLSPLYVDTRISFHATLFEQQIRYLLEMEHGVETASRRLHDLTASLDPLAQSVARAVGNKGYQDQLKQVLSVHRELVVNVLHFLEPILGDIAEHYSVPNHLPKELIPRHEHPAFKLFFPSFASVFRVAPIGYLPLVSSTTSAGLVASLDPAKIRNVLSMDLGGSTTGLYVSNDDTNFISLANKDTSQNQLNAIFSWEFFTALDNPKREFLASGNQFERICLFMRSTGGRGFGAFQEYDIEDYVDTHLQEDIVVSAAGGEQDPRSDKSTTALSRSAQKFEQHWRKLEQALLPPEAADHMTKSQITYLSEFQKLAKQTRSQKTAVSTDAVGAPRAERSPLQLLRMVDREVSLSYFVISYSLDSPHYPPGACRGTLLDFDAADCLPSEAGWAHYHFQASTADPYNVSVSYRGRPLGPGARLVKNNIHTTNTMSRLAQWSSMISLYKSVNHYSPDLLFVHPLVGNCLLLKKLLESGPVKPKIVFVAINPTVPPPLEMAPNMRQYWELVDHGHRLPFYQDVPASVWKLQCSLQYAETQVMRKHGYVLDHVEHVFAVYVWKKAFGHDPWIASAERDSVKREEKSRENRKHAADRKGQKNPIDNYAGATTTSGGAAGGLAKATVIPVTQRKLEVFEINPPSLVEEEAHPADRCLVGLRPSLLYQKWAKGWYCSPNARVAAQLEFSMKVDLSPVTACQAEKQEEREDAVCNLYRQFQVEKIPVHAHNLPDMCKNRNTTGSVYFPGGDHVEQSSSAKSQQQLPDTVTVGLPTAPDEQHYQVKRQPEQFIDTVTGTAAHQAILNDFEDAALLRDVEVRQMTLLQSFAARVLHEQPLLKWFIEKDQRGRCFDGECECFPPYRGTMCDMEEPNRARINETEKLSAVLHFVMPDSPRDLLDIERALPSIWENLNKHYDYPVVIFHEGMSEASRRRIVLCSENRVWFASLGRNFASLDAVPEIWRDQIPIHQMPFALGYRHMCRWRSGPVFLEPVLQRFDYGMTLDTDSYFPGPWREDPFAMLKRTNKVAAFPHLGREAASVAVNFLYYYLLYCKMHNLNPRRTKILASLVEKNWKWYQQTFMSDIEILYLPWFRDPEGEYQKFFRYMDATGGFYLYRWGNNPFRTFAMGTFLDDEQVSLATVPYLHQEFCTCGGSDGECITVGVGNYNKTCPAQKDGDGESLDAKLLHLQPWRGLDWQVNRFEKEDFHRFVMEQEREQGG